MDPQLTSQPEPVLPKDDGVKTLSHLSDQMSTAAVPSFLDTHTLKRELTLDSELVLCTETVCTRVLESCRLPAVKPSDTLQVHEKLDLTEPPLNELARGSEPFLTLDTDPWFCSKDLEMGSPTLLASPQFWEVVDPTKPAPKEQFLVEKQNFSFSPKVYSVTEIESELSFSVGIRQTSQDLPKSEESDGAALLLTMDGSVLSSSAVSCSGSEAADVTQQAEGQRKAFVQDSFQVHPQLSPRLYQLPTEIQSIEPHVETCAGKRAEPLVQPRIQTCAYQPTRSHIKPTLSSSTSRGHSRSTLNCPPPYLQCLPTSFGQSEPDGPIPNSQPSASLFEPKLGINFPTMNFELLDIERNNFVLQLEKDCVGPGAPDQPPLEPETLALSEGLHKNYRRWQTYCGIALQFLEHQDAVALACYLIPAVKSLSQTGPSLSLQKGIETAVKEWMNLSNYDRMDYYQTAQKFVEKEKDELKGKQLRERSKVLQGSAEIGRGQSGEQELSGQILNDKMAAENKSCPKVKIKTSRAARLLGMDMKVLEERALTEYMKIMETLDSSQVVKRSKSKGQGREEGDRKVDEEEQQQEEEEEEEENAVFLEYLDRLCSDKQFVTKAGEVLNMEFLNSILSPDTDLLDLLALDEEHKQTLQDEKQQRPDLAAHSITSNSGVDSTSNDGTASSGKRTHSMAPLKPQPAQLDSILAPPSGPAPTLHDVPTSFSDGGFTLPNYGEQNKPLLVQKQGLQRSQERQSDFLLLPRISECPYTLGKQTGLQTHNSRKYLPPPQTKPLPFTPFRPPGPVLFENYNDHNAPPPFYIMPEYAQHWPAPEPGHVKNFNPQGASRSYPNPMPLGIVLNEKGTYQEPPFSFVSMSQYYSPQKDLPQHQNFDPHTRDYGCVSSTSQPISNNKDATAGPSSAWESKVCSQDQCLTAEEVAILPEVERGSDGFSRSEEPCFNENPDTVSQKRDVPIGDGTSWSDGEDSRDSTAGQVGDEPTEDLAAEEEETEAVSALIRPYSSFSAPSSPGISPSILSLSPNRDESSLTDVSPQSTGPLPLRLLAVQALRKRSRVSTSLEEVPEQDLSPSPLHWSPHLVNLSHPPAERNASPPSSAFKVLATANPLCSFFMAVSDTTASGAVMERQLKGWVTVDGPSPREAPVETEPPQSTGGGHGREPETEAPNQGGHRPASFLPLDPEEELPPGLEAVSLGMAEEEDSGEEGEKSLNVGAEVEVDDHLRSERLDSLLIKESSDRLPEREDNTKDIDIDSPASQDSNLPQSPVAKAMDSSCAETTENDNCNTTRNVSDSHTLPEVNAFDATALCLAIDDAVGQENSHMSEVTLLEMYPSSSHVYYNVGFESPFSLVSPGKEFADLTSDHLYVSHVEEVSTTTPPEPGERATTSTRHEVLSSGPEADEVPLTSAPHERADKEKETEEGMVLADADTGKKERKGTGDKSGSGKKKQGTSSRAEEPVEGTRCKNQAAYHVDPGIDTSKATSTKVATDTTLTYSQQAQRRNGPTRGGKEKHAGKVTEESPMRRTTRSGVSTVEKQTGGQERETAKGQPHGREVAERRPSLVMSGPTKGRGRRSRSDTALVGKSKCGRREGSGEKEKGKQGEETPEKVALRPRPRINSVTKGKVGHQREVRASGPMGVEQTVSRKTEVFAHAESEGGEEGLDRILFSLSSTPRSTSAKRGREARSASEGVDEKTGSERNEGDDSETGKGKDAVDEEGSFGDSAPLSDTLRASATSPETPRKRAHAGMATEPEAVEKTGVKGRVGTEIAAGPTRAESYSSTMKEVGRGQKAEEQKRAEGIDKEKETTKEMGKETEGGGRRTEDQTEADNPMPISSPVTGHVGINVSAEREELTKEMFIEKEAEEKTKDVEEGKDERAEVKGPMTRRRRELNPNRELSENINKSDTDKLEKTVKRVSVSKDKIPHPASRTEEKQTFVKEVPQSILPVEESSRKDIVVAQTQNPMSGPKSVNATGRRTRNTPFQEVEDVHLINTAVGSDTKCPRGKKTAEVTPSVPVAEMPERGAPTRAQGRATEKQTDGNNKETATVSKEPPVFSPRTRRRTIRGRASGTGEAILIATVIPNGKPTSPVLTQAEIVSDVNRPRTCARGRKRAFDGISKTEKDTEKVTQVEEDEADGIFNHMSHPTKRRRTQRYPHLDTRKHATAANDDKATASSQFCYGERTRKHKGDTETNKVLTRSDAGGERAKTEKNTSLHSCQTKGSVQRDKLNPPGSSSSSSSLPSGSKGVLGRERGGGITVHLSENCWSLMHQRTESNRKVHNVKKTTRAKPTAIYCPSTMKPKRNSGKLPNKYKDFTTWEPKLQRKIGKAGGGDNGGKVKIRLVKVKEDSRKSVKTVNDKPPPTPNYNREKQQTTSEEEESSEEEEETAQDLQTSVRGKDKSLKTIPKSKQDVKRRRRKRENIQKTKVKIGVGKRTKSSRKRTKY